MKIKVNKSTSLRKPQKDHSAQTYAVFCNGSVLGNFEEFQIVEMNMNNLLPADTMVKRDGVWVPLQDLNLNADPIPEATYAATPSNVMEQEEEISETFSADEEAEEDYDDTMVTCPHCWHRFGLSKINYIAQHAELIGDSILGSEVQQRFLPTVFNDQGYAIDAKGLVCQEMACPKCHLKIPEAVIDTPYSIFSIVGAPASGKSYFLTSMTWQLRTILPNHFDYTLMDTDSTFNSVLNNYESILFLNRNSDEYVALPKTELQGHDFSHQIMMNGMQVDLPLPFIFTLTPTPSNTKYQDIREGMQNIILYDNAGEHFEPGRDHVTNVATHHLIHSDGITFLYDPIKDSRMVTHCNDADPQVSQIVRGANQLILLNEMIGRIKKYKGMKPHEKYPKPLVVVIPKYDAWKDIFPVDLSETPFVHYSSDDMTYSLDVGAITNVSYMMRSELLRISPEVVATCEAFFSIVYFIPVSALGRMPEYDAEKDMIAIKPQHLQPIWAEVPILLQMWYSGRLDAVIGSIPEEYLEIENYKYAGDAVIFTLPGSPARETIPINYCNHIVYNSKIKKYIKMPPPQTVVEGNDHNSNSSQEDEFWNK